MFSVLLILLFLPLSSFLVFFLAGKKTNQWVGGIASFITLIGLVLSIVLAKELVNSPQHFVFEWFSLGKKSFTLSLQIDNLTLLMLAVVHLVALLVHVFSISYMHDDAGKWRYFAFLGLFVFSMLVIVLAGSLLLMYVGWELVGLSSYLLIGFWYEKPRAVWAAKKAFLLNRIGDAGFLVGILLLFWQFGTTEMSVISYQLSVNGSQTTENGLLIIGLLLFCGAIGKSAQFPLSAWLPDAMEGPTPVSALIHAATMVAAGIFLLARIHFLLTPDALLVVTLIGTITMLLGAYRAIFQTDIKKLLAYSTISQLGLMVMGMGVGAREASLFHLLTHAFFKAGLFLCAGAVIHAVHSQDMRQMGGLRQKMPVTFFAYTGCAAALAGLPFFSGFLSKDAILVEAFAWAGRNGGIAYFIPTIGLLSAGLTAFYVARQWRMVFLERSADSKSANPDEHLHETDGFMKIPMVILASLSVFIWFSWNPFDASHGWFFNLFKSNLNHQLHTVVAIASVIVAVTGLGLGYLCTFTHSAPSLVQLLAQWHDQLKASFIHRFEDAKQWVQLLREHDPTTDHFLFLITPMQKIAHHLSYFDQRVLDVTVNGFGYLTVITAHLVGRFDRMIVDGIVNGLAWVAGFFGNRTRSLHNGQIQSYFVAMLVGVLFLLFWMLS
ncbi:NADH-quinone oxidoreductase subunit L [Runella sp.]|jgi:NADH-quinone oxidoreductase subunit L|uniref:NADH-quinone oxidoreductase subunit L n=1 Tax=Runella sp. TaxID=1960881 RepID=UPI0026268FFC|nr:NADH-quinone oxidoreductase subunit L [Runella sp.]